MAPAVSNENRLSPDRGRTLLGQNHSDLGTETTQVSHSIIQSPIGNGNPLPCKPPIRVVLGTVSVGSEVSPMAKITTVESLAHFISRCRERGYNDIDTARAYPVGKSATCEELLGQAELKLQTWANISTKVTCFVPGCHRTQRIKQSIEQSLTALGATGGVDIMYLHAPDRATSFAETCEAMHNAWKEGKFQRFGLSNYTTNQVKKIVKICNKGRYNPPTVYQGQYNLICRGAEARLLAVLRKHGIAFYASSPSACGFFSRPPNLKGRWNPASLLGAKYVHGYVHSPLLQVADTVRTQADLYKISCHAAALRWIIWHSQLDAASGDAIIIGASTTEQLEKNLDIIEQGPLPEDLVDIIDKTWDRVKQLERRPHCSFVQPSIEASNACLAAPSPV